MPKAGWFGFASEPDCWSAGLEANFTAGLKAGKIAGQKIKSMHIILISIFKNNAFLLKHFVYFILQVQCKKTDTGHIIFWGILYHIYIKASE
jgi:hypothetical protein